MTLNLASTNVQSYVHNTEPLTSWPVKTSIHFPCHIPIPTFAIRDISKLTQICQNPCVASALVGTLANICKSGFSSASTQLYLTIKVFVINNLITLYIGQPCLSAFNICYNSLFILYMFLIGTAQTMSPIVSVYYQEEDYQSVGYIMSKSLKIVLTSSLILSVLLIVYPQILTFFI